MSTTETTLIGRKIIYNRLFKYRKPFPYHPVYPKSQSRPFKRWLAKVGYERVQEIEDPELATKRTRSLYKAKGYPDDWIEKRMRGIAIRERS